MDELTKKKNKLTKIKDPNCLNCGHPFFGQENFCSDCGQKNKGSLLTFGNFIYEVFNGLFSWDAKFWKTIVPLLISPGYVSKEYVEGKRAKYSNPFRFYLTVSIIFFLILGLTSTFSGFNLLQKEKTTTSSEKEVETDSIKKEVIDDLKKKGIIDLQGGEILTKPLYSIKTTNKIGIINHINLSKIVRLVEFQKKYPKIHVDDALDSLKIKKTFLNRFWFTRAKTINSFLKNKNEGEKKFLKQMMSYSSISLFILLPLFALFLKLIYIRKKRTYVEHLVFTFHVQTVFFLLSSIFYIIVLFKGVEKIAFVLSGLFLVYLFLAMKKFYNQNYFKTSIKFILANIIFLLLSVLGLVVISFIAFIFY